MSQDRTGRPRGSRNIKPSKAAVANYYRLLQDKADTGDTAAAGWLLLLNEQRQDSERSSPA
ncbi:hypothetical protein [Billgrantia montanilacus]|uniref:Uncharacterized protein n=1 Tax=Billgrantia montanilacus TaxID=2282305 RepID=A0A368U0A2_9GAMM|nr:hypothetical protein [Halomonas montanilacus]RCV90495.1 hypothetical protein DU505_06045 [Halomonas montanilacus]